MILQTIELKTWNCAQPTDSIQLRTTKNITKTFHDSTKENTLALILNLKKGTVDYWEIVGALKKATKVGIRAELGQKKKEVCYRLLIKENIGQILVASRKVLNLGMLVLKQVKKYGKLEEKRL